MRYCPILILIDYNQQQRVIRRAVVARGAFGKFAGLVKIGVEQVGILRGRGKAGFAVVRDAVGVDLAARNVAIRALQGFAAIVG